MSRPLKHIAFVVKYFPTISETFIVNQINGVIDAGYKVSLFAYNCVDGKIIHESLKRHDLLDRVQYFKKPPISKPKRFLVFLQWTIKHILKINWVLFFKSINIFKYGKEAYTLKLFYESQWFLIPNDIDLIHAHFGMNGERIAYLKAHGIIPKNVKLINTFHGYDLEPNKLSLYRKTYANLFKYADAFTVNTPYLEGLLKQVNVYNKQHYILPVGLDTSFFNRTGIKKKNGFFEIVFCGRLIAFKAPNLAIQILKSLHQRGYTQVRLHIIGTGPMRKQLRDQAVSLGLHNDVIFHNSQNQIAIKQHFEHSDVFLLPGIHDPETGRAETQGLVIQEAQAMELPVVVSDAGGMKYGLLPNKSGFVIAENDLEGFVNNVEKLILNQDLRQKMGKIGRQFVFENYDSNLLNERLIKIYKNN